MLSITAIHGQTAKKLAIQGLRVFTEDELYSHLNLKRFDDGEISISHVIYEIENFYKENGYLLVKVYTIDTAADDDIAATADVAADDVNDDNISEIFVDEGRIGKVIVHNLGSFQLLKFRQMIDIPERIYSKEVINQNLKELQKEFPQFDITVDIRRISDYESSIVQLDRELQRISFLKHFDSSFLARYTGQNDLHFFVARKKGDNNSQHGNNVKIEFKLHYKFESAVIPQVLFSKDSIFFEKDYFRSVFSIGYDFGFRELINKSPSFSKFMPHEMSFTELRYEYKIGLIDSDFLGPLINGKLYRSNTSRGDLGILRYDYSFVKTVLAPEFTLLKNFNIYAGLGFETLSIGNTIINYQKNNYLDVSDHVGNSEFTEIRLKFDPIKIDIGNKIDRYVVLTYDRYFRGSHFEQLELNSIYETGFYNFSILSLSLKGFKLFGKPQFYRSEEVNDKYFLGFIGKEYYTNGKLAVSTEYRFSIYRDFVYLGVFLDSTIFKPEGYIISGTKFGIGYGPTMRLLVYDQYQFIVYYGYDILYPDKERGTNLNMRFSRRW